MTGIVKNLVIDRAFGFIKANGTEYFFHREDFNGHWNNLVEDWNNQKKIPVEFEAEESLKGPRAAKVHRTDFPNEAV